MASIGLIIGATVILKIADKRIYVLTCLIPLGVPLRNRQLCGLLDGHKRLFKLKQC